MDNNKNKNRKRLSDDWMVGWTDRHIILSLSRFELMACGRIRCAQLQAGCFDQKHYRGQPYIETEICMNRVMERQRDTETERRTYICIISTGPHWFPLGPSVEIASI